MFPILESHHAALTAMLAPALLMTATASLLASANARLARVVDRLRTMMAAWDDDGADVPGTAERDAMIARHRRRAHLVLRACQWMYAAMGSFVGTSLALAVDALLGFRLGIAPTVLAVLGVCFLLLACAAMGREVGLAVSGFDREIEHGLPGSRGRRERSGRS